MNPSTSTSSPVSTLVGPLLVAAAALGAGGARAQVVTIDPAKALAGNVTPGDAPGYPVTLSQPGSYRLMAHLVVPDLATTAVHIVSPGVRLDLNGFELRGPNTCIAATTTTPLICSSHALPGNAVRGHGVLVQLPHNSPATVAIENGSVRGFGAFGLRGLDGGFHGYAVRQLQVSNNGYWGIERAVLVSDSVVDHNGAGGISWSHGVWRNTVFGNRATGIHGSRIGQNDVHSNNPDFNANTPLP